MLDRSPVAIEAVFRTKYGELCASLLSAFGYQRFDLVEEALQTACGRALERWPQTGVPDNPAGWLYAVARNICLEGLRHAAVVDRVSGELRAAHAGAAAPDPEAELIRAAPLLNGCITHVESKEGRG
jgi:RNA polymerase sigma-70 factor (ECF subfamily)